MGFGRGLLKFATRNYLVLTFTTLIWNLGFSTTSTYFSLYVLELGGTETTIGLIQALGSGGYIFSIIVGGYVVDLYGRKKLLGVMSIASGMSCMLLAAAPNWQLLAIAAVIMNLCWAGDPAFWAMLADSISERYRGRAFAFFSFVNSLPWVVMPYLGGVLVDLKGVIVAVRWMLLTSALLGAVAGIAQLLLLEETLPVSKGVKGNAHSGDVKYIIMKAFREHYELWISMPRPLLALALTYMIWSFEFGLVEPYWIVYAEEEIGLTSTQWGIITAAGNVVSLIFKFLVVGSILDRFQRRMVLLAVLAFDSFNYLLFIFCRSFSHTLLLWIYASIVWSFYEATYSSMEADLIPKERRGRMYAALDIAWSAFSIPASIIGGFVYEKVSPKLSFILASMIVLLCLAVT
ncbi:MFS transporter, partial [Candidatus Bathyarchaeota archaeon]